MLSKYVGGLTKKSTDYFWLPVAEKKTCTPSVNLYVGGGEVVDDFGKLHEEEKKSAAPEAPDD